MGSEPFKWRKPEYEPAAAVAAAAGSLAAGAFCCGALPWYAVPIAVGAAFLLLTRPGALLVLGGASAVLVSYGFRGAFASGGDLGAHAVYGRMTLRIADSRISALPELSEGVRTAAAELLDFSECGESASKAYGGTPVFVRFPRNAAPPVYGTLLTAEGALTPVAALRVRDGTFSFPSFLKRRGFAAYADVRSFRIDGRRPGVRGRLLDVRDAMLKTLLGGVRDLTVRRLAAALYCGIGSGMPGDLRREFAAAGIVHIFSVSGMHVAVLAMFLGVVLRAMPFRVRWPLLASAVWLYVIGTGAGTPAVRAGVMVTLWCLLRMALLRISGFEVLCWTAVLLLVADPMLAASVGAQYSFLITGTLLLLAERGDRIKFPGWDFTDFVPPQFLSAGSRRAARFRRAVAMLFAGAVTAFFAGAGISLAASAHRLMPGTIVANILVSLLMPGYFLLFFIQLFAGFCGIGEVVAPLFESAFAVLRGIAAVTARTCFGWRTIPPHWSLAALYSLALIVFFRARDRRVRGGAVLTAAILMLCWIAAPSYLPPTVMVRSGGYASEPLVVVAEPARGIAVVVNLPDRENAASAAAFARTRGIREIELVGVSGRGGLRSLDALIRELPVKRVRLPESDAGGNVRRFRAASPDSAARFESERFHHDLFRLVRWERGFRLDYFDLGSKLCFVMTVLDCDRGREVLLEPASAPPVAATLPWSLYPGVWKYEFK